MTLNAYTKLCTDCKLPSKKSKACRQCDIDTIFIAIDKSDALAAKKEQEAHDDGQQHREKALDRVEFMVAMLRIAIGKSPCRASHAHDINPALLLRQCIVYWSRDQSSHPRCLLPSLTRQVHPLGGDGRRLRRAQPPAVGQPAGVHRRGGAGAARRLPSAPCVHGGGVRQLGVKHTQAPRLSRSLHAFKLHLPTPTSSHLHSPSPFLLASLHLPAHLCTSPHLPISPKVCTVLKHHEHQLHRFFDHACTLTRGTSSRSLSIESWLEQVRWLNPQIYYMLLPLILHATPTALLSSPLHSTLS